MPNAGPGLSLFKTMHRENPFDKIVRDAGPFDAENPLSILGFFQILICLIDFLFVVSFSDSDLYNMLASVSVRSLRACVLQAKQLSWSVPQFHSYVLNKFVPRLIYQQWLTEYYYRIQRTGESLPDFVAEKIFYASVLKVPDDEAQIVAIILQGLNFETRSRIVFAFEPHTFAELSDLAIRFSNYAIIDNMTLLFLLILLPLRVGLWRAVHGSR